MTSKWVDFKTVREKLDFVEVLSHYGIESKGRGKQVKIICPFHDDHKPSCGVNVAKQVYNCFACGAGGNALDFVAHMEGLDPDKTAELRKAALLASEIFHIEEATIKPKTRGVKSAGTAKNSSQRGEKSAKPGKARKSKPKASEGKTGGSEPSEPSPAKQVNKPLSFELKLDRKDPFIKSRIKDGGLDKKLVKTFGLGFCSKGIMSERVCFPIHNVDGELIAYSGRWASDSLPDDVPRYLLPKGFEKSKVLFNLHRVIGMHDSHPDIDTVVIVEGFWSVMRLHGEGIPCVSTFGDSVSPDQVELLVQNGFKNAILIFDGDEGGRAGTEQSLPLLAEKLFTKVIHLGDGIKPDVMDKQLVSELPRYS